ncbi:hypothetical protein KA525_03855 [Candidatus Woesebacteria bacterium]|jgi:hypothetical protein|nr:hypothetical protein [Candidatus Woesebacteria bacterium]
MPAGRPLKFQTVEELQSKIDDYFTVTPKDEWTITGLAIHLDTFRSVLCDYEEKDEFSNAVKKAKQRVENGYEIDLKKHGRSGTIFALKNFDWRDKNETDITSGGKPIIQVSDEVASKHGIASSSETNS